MTDTQPIPLAASRSDDRRSNSTRVGRHSNGADTDTLTDAPDPTWEGHATVASVFDVVGTWACLHGAQHLFCSRTPKGIAIWVWKK